MSEVGKPTILESVDELIITPEAQIVVEPESVEQIAEHTQERKQPIEKSPFQDFLFDLREKGVQASTSEWLDLQRALEGGAVESIDDFYLVSKSLLVKDVSNFARFNTAFEELMSGHIGGEEESANEEDEEELSEQKPTDEYEQKEEENIQQVVESESQTSEEVHGGKEATKDIENSPSAANDGKDKQNHGAEEGKADDKPRPDGKSPKDNGKNADNHGAKEGLGSDKPEESDDEAEGDKGKGTGFRERFKESRKEKPLRERLQNEEIKKLDRESPLTREQIGVAFAKLTALIRDSSEMRSRKLDTKKTVKQIAQNGGIPKLSWEDSVEVKPKVMILFDVGGSTDEFRPVVEELFAAAKDHIDELNIFYFHNAPYGEVWPQSDGNWPKNLIPIERILDKDPSTNVIIVGDAWMAQEELWDKGFYPDSEPANGMETLKNIKDTYESLVWINPIFAKDHDEWDESGTISDIRAEFDMYDLNLDGLEKAVSRLLENNLAR